MANFIGLVYATLKNEGVDTSGMSTDEAVAKYNELQRKSGGKAGEKEGTPAENRRINKSEYSQIDDYGQDVKNYIDLVSKKFAEVGENIKFKEGNKYIKLINENNSVIAFIDKDGYVYQPENANKPKMSGVSHISSGLNKYLQNEYNLKKYAKK